VDRLRQLLAESLSPTDQAELISHLDACDACQDRLEKLAGAKPALLDAARTLPRAAYVGEVTLHQVLERLKNDSRATMLYPPPERKALVQTLGAPSESVAPPVPFEGFEVADLLGQGGMGLVFKAYEAALKRWVAIKVLSPELADDVLARHRFAREGQAAAAVRHEHVVAVHAVREAGGLPYLVMEYVEGGSLQDYLNLDGPADWQTVARIGAEVAEGLAAAHAMGVVHRDIKPSNILLSGDITTGPLGRAKIGDFGLARAADETRLTLTGTVLGTPMYMAPEQARCEMIDERTDLFSLGSVLYALATGQEPFPSGSPMAVLLQVCEAAPRPIRELNPAIPAWLIAVIERLHAKRPADRFATAAELAGLLRYNLDHPDEPRMVQAPRHPAPRHRRRKQRLLGLLGVLLVLAAGLAVGESLRWTHVFSGWGLFAEGRKHALPLRATLRGHEGPVWSVAFAPDGKTVATGSDDTFLCLWDTATGRQTARLSGHGRAVVVVNFTPSGKFVIGGGGDGVLRIWDVATGKEQPELALANANLRRALISPDGKTVAVGSSTQVVELWDLEKRTLRLQLQGHHGTIQAIAFAPDGKTMATGDMSGWLRLWDPASGTEESSFQADPLGLRALVFSPDSKTLASAGTGDRDLKLWDVASRQTTATLPGFENGALNMAFSPDGRLLAAGSRGGSVKVWAVSTGEVLSTLEAHQGAIGGVAFSPDSRTLATVGEDRLGKLWDVSSLAGGKP
jgi:WD40 repeat protein/tRNA A-37 threonylcarbamoyl transferase component Bud32